MGGNYLDFTIDREAIARYGLTVGDIQDVMETAIGGMNITTTVEGLERYPVNLRYSRELRDDLPSLRAILVATPGGQQIPLGQFVDIQYVVGPPGIKSENAKPNAWVYVDIRNIDVGTYVARAQEAVAANVTVPPGYTIAWSGQYEYMLRAQQRLLYIVPVTLLLIFVIIYVHTGSAAETLLVLAGVPFALTGSVWLLYVQDYNLSVAVWVGVIALAGLYAETAIVLLLYLDQSYHDMQRRGLLKDRASLIQAIYTGSVRRVRPILMTVATDVIGLLPIMWSTGTGADVMKRVATPLIGGVITSGFTVLVIYPVVYYLWRSRGLPKGRPFTGFRTLKETS
jgi:Cu(I)/Ag(I) efflux system membrane protein CusA/SilA